MYVKCCNCIDTRKVFDKMTKPDVSSPCTGSVSANATNRVCTNGVVDLALSFFKEIPQRDVISLNAMVAGYARDGFVEKALERFNQTRLGMDIHQSIIESELMSDVVVVSALVDMYARCSIQKVPELFDKIAQGNVISWNAMTAGYAQNGFFQDALKLFDLIKRSGMHPDHPSHPYSHKFYFHAVCRVLGGEFFRTTHRYRVNTDIPAFFLAMILTNEDWVMDYKFMESLNVKNEVETSSSSSDNDGDQVREVEFATVASPFAGFVAFSPASSSR
ncbi:pentatricopeptide repeat-containing protein At2g13600-like [Cryptomeria japonica]|uniref:pentatricopeptide repeat-containing protein At2g13600-like n=1 Tax=Cryptomeria japonica TaxID=3369 RepID=UPI0027DA65E9|nr:pentatricopeptide repeat-containing protein At2g13600-like [Cryptomeria japonica]